MDENILKLRVGIFVLIAMVILGILISLNSEGLVSQYTVYVEPTNAPGVTVGTPIRKNGILIGRVKSVVPEDDHVILRLGINDNIRIYENETCEIGHDGLLGDSVVEFITMPREQRGEELKNEQMVSHFALKQSIDDATKTFTMMMPKLEKVLEVVYTASNNLGNAGAEVEKLAKTINSTFQGDDSDFKQFLADVRNMAQKGDAAFDNFNRMFEHLNDVVGDPEIKHQIKEAFSELPKIVRQISDAVTTVGETFSGFQTIPDDVKRVTDNAIAIADNIKPFSASLGQHGPEIVTEVQLAVQEFKALAKEAGKIKDLIRQFNESDGTIKKLLLDDEAYRSLKATLGNIESMSEKLAPLMKDLRTVGDKLGRNPGSILSGSLQGNRSHYKGTNRGHYRP